MKMVNLMAMSVMVVVLLSASSAQAIDLPGQEMTIDEIAKCVGACGPKCLAAGKVCGFGVVEPGSEYITDCCGFWKCQINPAAVSWKCGTGFTNRKTCQGSYTPDPGCDSTASSIDCGSGSTCLMVETTCNGCDCITTGVAICGGIPYITDCGSFATCG